MIVLSMDTWITVVTGQVVPVHTIIVEEIPNPVNAMRPVSNPQRCITPNGGLGQCTHLLRCPLPEFNVDKLRFMDYFCIIDRVYVGVCCPDSYLYKIYTGQSFSGNPAGYLPAIGVDLAPVIDAIIEDEEKTNSNRCGVNQNEYYSRVVGGRPADPKQWPWMVSLIKNREHFCGGVLITSKHILTAAHCFRGINPKSVIARLGEHDLTKIGETRTQDFRISDSKSHPDFDMNSYENDIAILKTDRPITFNSYAWPVCLPQPGADFVDEEAIVIGWGAIEYGGPTSNVLMEVSVPVWNNTKCDNEFVQPILETNLCAGGQSGRDSCQGDSGGPLLYQLPNKRWITIGVVSWGIRCGEDRPAVYTKVSKYLNWIIKNSAL
ncbi:tripsin, putative [Pediculus humanus corporis]|uniref:Phenoloxidase-activating factor 2 n=1 Tax=Pediculus humanus subsp. corporis TaxID=121224 RepID=E0VPJ3_PEDHC|nr:tripsin, putative [Pediculus humanus corporis]EEB15299.1 tripsin, putative [Pediculus humanus corporis]